MAWPLPRMCQAAQSRQARPEEAQEPSLGVAKGSTLSALHSERAAAQVEVPPVGFLVEVLLGHLTLQLAQPLLALAWRSKAVESASALWRQLA